VKENARRDTRKILIRSSHGSRVLFVTNGKHCVPLISFFTTILLQRRHSSLVHRFRYSRRPATACYHSPFFPASGARCEACSPFKSGRLSEFVGSRWRERQRERERERERIERPFRCLETSLPLNSALQRKSTMITVEYLAQRTNKSRVGRIDGMKTYRSVQKVHVIRCSERLKFLLLLEPLKLSDLITADENMERGYDKEGEEYSLSIETKFARTKEVFARSV